MNLELDANTVKGSSKQERYLEGMLDISTEFLDDYLKIYFIKIITYIMNFECSICLSNEPKSLSIINCNHSFHSKCINRWLEQEEHCPICRTEYSDFDNIEKLKTESNKQKEEKTENNIKV